MELFCSMALGWVLGTWIMEWLLGLVWRDRAARRVP
jgi:hypothetical protein